MLPLDVVAALLGTLKDPDPVLLNMNYFIDSGDENYLYDVLESFKNLLNVDSETMFLEVSKHFEEGALKYGEYNWQKGIPTHCYVDSAVRHYLKVLRGDDDERHDRAFVWNILCCIWTCIHTPGLNDYTKKEDTSDGLNRTAGQG